MARRATQIYLTDDQHTALDAAARRSGRSKTQVLRDLIDGHLVPDASPPTDLSRLAGSVRIGRSVDIARDRDAMVSEVLADLRRR